MIKIYLRILRYSPNLGLRLVLFFVYSLFGTVFGTVNFTLAIPLMNVLFKKTEVTLPAAGSTDYFSTLFKQHFSSIIQEHGIMTALLFICVLIISATLV